MSYGLGIDVGTGRTSAATVRVDGHGRRLQPVPLGHGTDSVPSALRLAADGSIGGPADAGDERACRDFVRRVGGAGAARPHRPEELTAHLVRWVVDAVARSEGRRADRIVLTHPGRWGARERASVATALAALGIDEVEWIAAPAAAAAGCDVPDLGGTVVVYDLGATFSAAVLTADTGGRRTVHGAPRDLVGVGGGEFDGALAAEVFDRLGDRLGADLDDPGMVAAMAQLEADCTVARETLSLHPEAVIPVVLPGVDAWIDVTRDQYEELIRPALGATVDLVHGVVRSAGLALADLDSVLVAGGLGATPMIARMLQEELGVRVVVAPEPQHAAALGAALAATPTRQAAVAAPAVAAVPGTVIPEDTVIPDVRSPRPRRIPALLAAAGILAAVATVVPISVTGTASAPHAPSVSTVDGAAPERPQVVAGTRATRSAGTAPDGSASDNPASDNPAPDNPVADGPRGQAAPAGTSRPRIAPGPGARPPATPGAVAVGPRTVPGAGPGTGPRTTTTAPSSSAPPTSGNPSPGTPPEPTTTPTTTPEPTPEPTTTPTEDPAPSETSEPGGSSGPAPPG